MHGYIYLFYHITDKIAICPEKYILIYRGSFRIPGIIQHPKRIMCRMAFIIMSSRILFCIAGWPQVENAIKSHKNE